MGVLCATQSQAQWVRIGPEVGVNFQKFNVEDEIYDDDYDMRAGLKVGGIVDIGVDRMFSVQPGLFYSQKGTKQKYVESVAAGFRNHVKNDIKINYLEIPLNLQLKFGTPHGPMFFIGAGPYLGFAIGGEVEQEITTRYPDGSLYDRDRDDYDLEFGDDADDDNYKGSDAGINLNLGFMTRSGFFLRGNMGIGLKDIVPDGVDSYSAKNFGLGISAGFLFGK